MRSRWLAARAALALTLTLLAGAGQAVYVTDTIYIEGVNYVNPVTVVPPGSFVIFDNAEFVNSFVPDVGSRHTATADDGSFDTGVMGFHEIVGFTIDRPSGTTITFHCQIHSTMHGAIVVA